MTFAQAQPRTDGSRRSAACVGSVTVAFAGSLFVLAAAAFPGGGYNPFFRMLSALGRSEIRQVAHPLCQGLFMAGLFVAALGICVLARRLKLSLRGAALNAAGLAVIALVPENVSMVFHNAGCWIAAIGGGLMLLRWFAEEKSRRVRRFWTVLLVASLVAIGSGLLLHAVGAVRFAPWVPTAQKGVILSFAAWLFFLSVRSSRASVRRTACAVALVPVALAAVLFGRPTPDLHVETVSDRAEPVRRLPLSAEELESLAWLEYVTGPLPPADEQVWWGRDRRQFSIFSKRYGIAFSGYAAAALGQRGDAAVRSRVGRILGRCVERMLDRDVWGYSQAKSYWGRKPWAPDPCYRENVMYTGHLLQLLAYYELFTGDRRYHRAGGGWDFVWKDGRRVHYDVEKLIDVTVEQMRKGPNGGIACEPGLMFFACNNHPHVALDVFKTLGYGDWTADARRWEKWSIEHLVAPTFGGGSLGLVYHVRSNIVYPRGQNGFDGWSLLWYEAWASDRRIAKALWREASARIDWTAMERALDVCAGRSCCDPEPAPAPVVAVFLAAAARACDDPATAERLEAVIDARYEHRERGMRWLALNPEWRLGATAMRIIAQAESRGTRFRTRVD